MCQSVHSMKQFNNRSENKGGEKTSVSISELMTQYGWNLEIGSIWKLANENFANKTDYGRGNNCNPPLESWNDNDRNVRNTCMHTVNISIGVSIEELSEEDYITS